MLVSAMYFISKEPGRSVINGKIRKTTRALIFRNKLTKPPQCNVVQPRYLSIHPSPVIFMSQTNPIQFDR